MLILLTPRAETAVGLDLSQQMLNIARLRVAEAGLDHVELRHGDIFATGLPGGSADSGGGPSGAPLPGRSGGGRGGGGPAGGAPGGRLLIVDFAPHALESLREALQHRRLGFPDDEMTRWLTGAGLNRPKITTLPAKNGRGPHRQDLGGRPQGADQTHSAPLSRDERGEARFDVLSLPRGGGVKPRGGGAWQRPGRAQDIQVCARVRGSAGFEALPDVAAAGDGLGALVAMGVAGRLLDVEDARIGLQDLVAELMLRRVVVHHLGVDRPARLGELGLDPLYLRQGLLIQSYMTGQGAVAPGHEAVVVGGRAGGEGRSPRATASALAWVSGVVLVVTTGASAAGGVSAWAS